MQPAEVVHRPTAADSGLLTTRGLERGPPSRIRPAGTHNPLIAGSTPYRAHQLFIVTR